MIKNAFAMGLLLVSAAASAQSGWSRAGAAFGGAQQRNQDAYNRGVMYGAELRYLQESARAAKLDADRMEAEAAWKDTLAKAWKAGGLNDAEASSVASVYQLTMAQNAILERAKHQGVAPTIADAWGAYRQYNYLLADQLVVAALIVQQDTAAK